MQSANLYELEEIEMTVATVATATVATATERMPKSSVACLSHQEISEMDREELIEAIRAVPTISSRTQQLEYASRDTLERMVYLVRRCCRQQGY